MNPTLNLSSTVKASPEQLSAELEDETVVLSLESGVYYGLNEVAARIWTFIAEERQVAAIVDQLLTEYEVDRSVCEAEVLDVLRHMLDSGLLEVGAAR